MKMIYNKYLTKKEVLAELKNAKNTDFFCVYCYEKLIKTKDGLWYCPNEMCMNDEQGEIDEI